MVGESGEKGGREGGKKWTGWRDKGRKTLAEGKEGSAGEGLRPLLKGGEERYKRKKRQGSKARDRLVYRKGKERKQMREREGQRARPEAIL